MLELQVIMKFLYLAAVYDQLDLPQLTSAELLGRRGQMIELEYKDKFKLNAKGAGGGKNKAEGPGSLIEDSHLYLGISGTRGLLCVAPELESHVGKQLNIEYLAIKERRKAEEAKK